MPSFTRACSVTAPPGFWTDVALLECHDFAPLFSGILYSLATEYGDRDGWVDERYATPGALLRTLGPVAQAMRLTKPKAAEVLAAMAAAGHLERAENGAVRMAGYADLWEQHRTETFRSYNSERARETHARKIKYLADKSMLTVEPSTLTPGDSTLTQAPSTLTTKAPAANDAPAGSSTVQDRHYQSSPSGSCSKKETGEIGIGGCGGKGEENQAPRPAAKGRRLSADDATRMLASARTREATPAEWPLERRLCVRMLRLMIAAKPNRVLPTAAALNGWETDMRLLLKDRNGDHAAINRVLMWALEPGSFWAPNIASPAKLRAKFDQIEAQMQRDGAQGVAVTPVTTTTPPPYVRVFRLEDEGRVS